MRRMILVRIGSLLAVLLVLTLVVFIIAAVLPADPVRASVGAQATERGRRGEAPRARLRQAAAGAVRQLPRQGRAGRLR